MKDIGDLLKKEREKKKLTIKEVAVATKINSSVLIAMEEGNEKALPPKPFLRGFVQTYSRHLGLDVDQMMQMFTTGVGTTKPQLMKPETESSADDNNTLDFINRKWDLIKKGSVIAGIVVLVGFAWFLIETINKYEEESKQAAERKETVITQVSTNTVNTSPTPTESAAPNAVAPTPPALAAATATPTPNVAEPKASPVTTPLVMAPVATPTSTPKPTATPTSASVSPQQVIIEALDSVRVRYTIDGGSSKSIELKPEQILTVKGQSQIVLSLSDGGAVNVIYNGRDTGVPGNLGQAIDLSFPK